MPVELKLTLLIMTFASIQTILSGRARCAAEKYLVRNSGKSIISGKKFWKEYNDIISIGCLRLHLF